MKRIVFFINSLGSGGAEHQIIELSNGLIEKQYDVIITTYSDVEDFYCFNSLIKRHRIASEKPDVIKLLAIWWYFIRIKADWVVCFGRRANKLGILPLLFRSRKKIRIIAGERCASKGYVSKGNSFIYDLVYQRADFIVTNSYSECNQILEMYPKHKDKLLVITNYTDINYFRKVPIPNGDVIYIGVFGRYNEQKNCILFVDAIRLLKEKTNIPFRVEWYGNKRYKDNQVNPYYELMKNKTEKYGLENNLHLNDQTKDVLGEMKRFDAICLPSLYEGFSNSISEAICCGKPCIVSDVADNGIMVKDGINGFLFNPNNVDEIVDAFLKFFSLSTNNKEKMAKASRHRAEELFDRERFLNSYIQLFESK